MTYNNTTTGGCDLDCMHSTELHLAVRVAMGIIAVLSICSNGLLILLFLRNRVLLRSSYNVLILSLAVTDMTTGIGLILTPAYVIGVHNFPIPGGLAGELFCRIVVSYYLVFTLGIVSVYTITCLSLERWFAVAKPAKYRAGFKSYRIYVMVVTVWLVSFLFNAPHLFEMKLAPGNHCVWVSLTEGDVRKGVALVEFLGKFFIPLVVTSLSFLSLWIKVKDSPALFQTNKGKAGVRLLRMCAIIAVVLAICWFPNQVYYLLFKFDITQMDTTAHQVTVVLCMGNSTLNPFIYCVTNQAYRKHFMKFLCPCRKSGYGLEETRSDDKEGHRMSSSTTAPVQPQFIPRLTNMPRNNEYYSRSVSEIRI